MPDVKIILGGPEVSYTPEKENLFGADIVVTGEGEASFYSLVSDIVESKGLKNIYKAKNVTLDEIPFCYSDCINEYENKIIYYESSRGCPFNCQYCLSSTESGVRFLSKQRVRDDLDFFIKNKVKQVKFVDRTFNCNENHALSIWNHIIESDNGITNFHFEISADLLTNEMFKILKKARPGLIQFEIGVQSTNIDTLSEIKRKTNLDSLFYNVNRIKSLKNIHIHLDLIVGLPHEGFNSFADSFNKVFALKPDMLQIGFLKLLRGSGLRNHAEKFGITYKDYAPYEVLYTNDLSFNELIELKSIENIVDIFYNSNNFSNTLEYGIKKFNTPFNFFHEFSNYWEDNSYDAVNHSKIKLYEILFNFTSTIDKNMELLRDLIKFDMFLSENIKNPPNFITRTDYSKIKTKINDFYKNTDNMSIYFTGLENYDSKKISKICHIEKFDFDILSEEIKKIEIYVLFNYYSKKHYKIIL